MKTTKFLISFLAIIFCIATAKGQDNVLINLANENNVTVAIDNIQRITFDGDNMLLETINGNENSYSLDDIIFITFIDEEMSIKNVAENIDISIYINASGEIIVQSLYEINKLTIFDLEGRELAVSTQSSLNVNFLNVGVYLLKVETNRGALTKKFIKTKRL